MASLSSSESSSPVSSSPGSSSAANVAASYYDSSDADLFYAEIWGGEDIHIGLYESNGEAISQASERTVETLMKLAGAPPVGGCVVDLGSGYGGAARRMAAQWQVNVHAINISSVENSRHRELNAKAGLADRITVHDASFESVPLPDGIADVVWSQDAILHSGNRLQVMQEVSRLLKPGGVFVLTDPMASDEADPNALRPILDRIHLADLASPDRYQLWADASGLKRQDWFDRTEMLVMHYTRVREELRRRQDELAKVISLDYLNRMDVGLGHWIEGGSEGRLCWGMMRFLKA
ncbi:MAG: methyltransferase domain-containing protein [Prochlorococcus sp.]|nr:methyltransferase domain-containing protein [Prochlorococcus sp.]